MGGSRGQLDLPGISQSQAITRFNVFFSPGSLGNSFTISFWSSMFAHRYAANAHNIEFVDLPHKLLLVSGCWGVFPLERLASGVRGTARYVPGREGFPTERGVISSVLGEIFSFFSFYLFHSCRGLTSTHLRFCSIQGEHFRQFCICVLTASQALVVDKYVCVYV